MSSTTTNQYAIYINECKNLAKTIRIKSENMADANNAYLSALYGTTISSDQTTWKYYLNLAGEYHSTDTTMTVTSLDTQEQIVFNKTNLAIHLATATAYAFGTREYLALVATYPEQEALILGILYPIDITTAVNADDYTILGYPASLVESNERSLISRLQTWVTNYVERWINPAYVFIDPLYLSTMIGIMYLGIFQGIVSFRNDATNTSEAHSFHVRQYLLSNGLADDDISLLSLKQSMWLYQNIRYVRMHAGRTETFEKLIDEILTTRDIPLAKYTMKHVLTDTLTTYLPTIQFDRTALNDAYSAGSSNSTNISGMLTKEASVADLNSTYQEVYAASLQSAGIHTLVNQLPTKVLESKMIDYTDATPYTLAHMLVSQWLEGAYSGTYASTVSITNPISGDTFALTVKEAYCLMWYSFCQSIGITLTTIPLMPCKRYAIHPVPALSTLTALVDSTVIDTSVATTLRNLMVTQNTVISTEAFYERVEAMHEVANQQLRIVSLQSDLYARAMAENMMSRLYADSSFDISDGYADYASWLTGHNLDFSDLSATDFSDMYQNILLTATGQDINKTTSVAAVQKAMISIMKTLSSYSVQYITDINDSSIIPSNWPILRMANIKPSIEDLEETNLISTDTIDWTGAVVGTEDYDVFSTKTTDDPVELKVFDKAEVVMPNLIDMKHAVAVYTYECPSGVSLTLSGAMDMANDGTIDVPGADAFWALSNDTLASFIDIAGNRLIFFPESNT